MRRTITQTIDASGKVIVTDTDTTRFLHDRYRGPWSGLMQISLEGMMILEARMADKTLGIQAVRVLWAMLNSMQVHDDNRVKAGRKDLARILAMHESDISKAIRKLVEIGLVEPPKLKFGYYTISPRFAWYGRTVDLRRALADRGMLDNRGMMMAAKRAA